MEIYLTLCTSNSYVDGARVLAQSLRRTGTSRPVCCMATFSLLSQESIECLKASFDKVFTIEPILTPSPQALTLLKRPDLYLTLTKLRLWQLDQENVSKVVFLDADTLVLSNIDCLFEREEFSASPDIGWPDCFNSGVFVAIPSTATFDKLMQLASSEGSFDGGDQGLLNTFFSDWSTGPSAKRLPFTFNLTISSWYSYRPAFEKFKNDVKIVHFIGESKPWNHLRMCTGSPMPRNGHSDMTFIKLWWKIYDEVHAGFIGSKNPETNFIHSGQNENSSSPFDQAGIQDLVESSVDHIGFKPSATCTEFASYRVKWNSDVENYFREHRSGHTPTLSHTSPHSESLEIELNLKLGSNHYPPIACKRFTSEDCHQIDESE